MVASSPPAALPAWARRPILQPFAQEQGAHATFHVQRYQTLKEERANFEFDWQDIVRYLVPGHDDILELHDPGQSRTTFIFDSQPLRAPQILAANMMGAVTNQAIEWRKLKFREERLNDIQAVSAWLQACDTRIMSAYSSSNFYQAAHTFYLNLASFGTAAMYAGSTLVGETGGQQLHFKTLATGSYCIAENASGVVDTLYRDVWLTPRQAIALFEGQVSQQVWQASERPGTMDKPLLFLHCVYPRQDRHRGDDRNRNMPYAGLYIEHATKFVNDESGYQEFPYLVARWQTQAKAPWGFGPGHIALPDVRMLNMLRELNMQQLVLWVQPPLKVLREGIVGNISLESLAMNVLTQMDALQPLETTGRPDLVQISQEDLRRSIDDAFYVNALQALPPPDVANMTAYEVAQRIELMTRTMGPVFYRLLAEFLTPLEDRVFGLAWRAGALPPPPLEVLRAAAQNQGQMDVEYSGPLARSQKGDELRSLQQYMQLTASAVSIQQNQDSLDLLDWDTALRDAAEILGLQSYRFDSARVEQVRRQRAQLQQQQVQAQMENERMKAMGGMAPMVQRVQESAQGQGTTAPQAA